MRRVSERKVTVELTELEVDTAILAMARCPKKFHHAASITFEDGGYVVRWTECSKNDNTQPDADPERSEKARAREAKARRDKIPMVGKTFGKWTVLAPADRRVFPGGGQQTMWLCRCECGSERDVNGHAMRSGKSTACPPCASGRVPDDERICKYCEVPLSPRSVQPTICPRCSRQIERMKKRVKGGLCPCGKFPYYPSKPCPKCDRQPKRSSNAKPSTSAS